MFWFKVFFLVFMAILFNEMWGVTDCEWCWYSAVNSFLSYVGVVLALEAGSERGFFYGRF